jgi:hypothetical protein
LERRYIFDPLEYLTAIERYRNRFGDRLMVRAGVAMGEPPIFVQRSADVSAADEFDFVLG